MDENNDDYNIDAKDSPFSRLFLKSSDLEVNYLFILNILCNIRFILNNNFKKWSEFMNYSGEEQDKFIENFESCSKKLKEKSCLVKSCNFKSKKYVYIF